MARSVRHRGCGWLPTWATISCIRRRVSSIELVLVHLLAKERIDCVDLGDRLIRQRVAALLVLADTQEEFDVGVACHELAHAGRVVAVLRRHCRVHQSAATAQHVDRGKMVAATEFAREDHMAVKQRHHLLGDRIKSDLAFDQHGVHAGDRPAASVQAGALDETRECGEQRRREAAPRRRFACRQPDLSLGARKAGEAVHEQQHLLALIAEMLCDRCRRIGSLDALHGRAV